MMNLGVDALNQVGAAEGLSLMAPLSPPLDVSLDGFVEAFWIFNGSTLLVVGLDGTVHYSRNIEADIGGPGALFTFADAHSKLYVSRQLGSPTFFFEIHQYNIHAFATGLSLEYVGAIFNTGSNSTASPGFFDPGLGVNLWSSEHLGFSLAGVISPPFDSVDGIGLAAIDYDSGNASFVWKNFIGSEPGSSQTQWVDLFSDGHRYGSFVNITGAGAGRTATWYIIEADTGASLVQFAQENTSTTVWDPASDVDSVLGNNFPQRLNYRQSFFDPSVMYIFGSHTGPLTDPGVTGNSHPAAILQNTVPPTFPSTLLFDISDHSMYQMRVYKAPQTLSFCDDDSCIPIEGEFPGLGRKQGVDPQPFQWGPALP